MLAKAVRRRLCGRTRPGVSGASRLMSRKPQRVRKRLTRSVTRRANTHLRECV
jgi:hypothetical protein